LWEDVTRYRKINMESFERIPKCGKHARSNDSLSFSCDNFKKEYIVAWFT
jgi:hypothetical protein